MKERAQRAMGSSDLGWSEVTMKDVDILTAMGWSDRHSDLEALGGMLLLIKTATRSRSLFYIPGNDVYQATVTGARDALSELCRNHQDVKPIRRNRRDVLAGLVITEWIHDACPDCTGAGEIKREDNSVVITCPACKGGKKRRYSDYERMEVLAAGGEPTPGLKAKYYATFERAMMVMAGTIGLAERAKLRATAEMLERY